MLFLGHASQGLDQAYSSQSGVILFRRRFNYVSIAVLSPTVDRVLVILLAPHNLIVSLFVLRERDILRMTEVNERHELLFRRLLVP